MPSHSPTLRSYSLSQQTWDLETLAPRRTFDGNDSWLYGAQYGRGAPLIATAGSNKHELRIYGRRSGMVRLISDFFGSDADAQKVASYTDTYTFYSLDMAASQLCGGGAGRSVALFDLDTSSALL